MGVQLNTCPDLFCVHAIFEVQDKRALAEYFASIVEDDDNVTVY